MFYCDQKDGFRPSTGLIEKKTGIRRNKVSEIRGELIKHGVITYVPGIRTTICWDTIRAFSMINLSGRRLEKSESKRAEYFSRGEFSEKKKTIRMLMAEMERSRRFTAQIYGGNTEDSASIDIDPRTLFNPECVLGAAEETEEVPRATESDLEFSKYLEGLREIEYVMLVKSFPEYKPDQQQPWIEFDTSLQQSPRWQDPFGMDCSSAFENDGGVFDEQNEAKSGYITRGETFGSSEEAGSAGVRYIDAPKGSAA